MRMSIKVLRLPVHRSLALASLCLAATSGVAAADAPRAINVGGPAYTAVDGTEFAAEAFTSGGTVANIDRVKGVQNPDLYKTCRVGDVRVDLPIADGTYDVTLYFAEPDELGRGERVFAVQDENRTVIGDLDVMLFRDGKIRSGLSVTAPDVRVDDGELSIGVEASVNEPLLCAVLVRDKMPRADDWRLTWSDEFEGDELDSSNWNIEEWEPGRVNDEDQAYTCLLYTSDAADDDRSVGLSVGGGGW